MEDAEDAAARYREVLVKRERKAVTSYLASPKCKIFSEVECAVSANESDIDMLLAAGGSLVSTMKQLKGLQAGEFKCRGIVELVMAVYSGSVSLSDHKALVHSYLSGKKCKLFRHNSNRRRMIETGLSRDNLNNQTVFLTQADVNKMVEKGGAGEDTLAVLFELERRRLTFTNLTELTKAVGDEYLEPKKAKLSPVASLESVSSEPGELRNAPKFYRPNQTAESELEQYEALEKAKSARRLQLVSYLASSQCKLFSEMEAVKSTKRALDSIIEETGSVSLAILSCRQLDAKGTKFRSVESLLESIRVVLLGASNQSSKSLTPPPMMSKNVPISLSVPTVKKPKVGIKQTTKEQRTDLLMFLASPPIADAFDEDCDVVVTKPQLDRLLREGGGPGLSVTRTKSALHRLCAQNVKNGSRVQFSSVEDLIEALKGHRALNDTTPLGSTENR